MDLALRDTALTTGTLPSATHRPTKDQVRAAATVTYGKLGGRLILLSSKPAQHSDPTVSSALTLSPWDSGHLPGLPPMEPSWVP